MHPQVQNTCLDQTSRVLYKFSKLCCKRRIYGCVIGKKTWANVHSCWCDVTTSFT